MSNLAAEAREHLIQIAEHINTYHAAAQKHPEKIVNALAAGTLLLEAKETCRHGEWLLWLEQHFDGSVRTAQHYMQIARRWQKIVEVSNGSVSDLSVHNASRLARRGSSQRRHTRR